MRPGYYLFPADALTPATISIVDALDGSKVDLWENGIGGIAGNVKPGRIYRAIIDTGNGRMGFYFRGYNFDSGYNYFNPDDPTNIL